MKKILSVLVLLCMLFALPAFAEEAAQPAAEAAETRAYATLVSDPAELIPVYVDEEAEGAIGSLEQAIDDFTIGGTIAGIVKDSGIYSILTGNWKALVMILISFVLLYLAIVKQFEPLLLMPIAFGMLLTNLPLAGIMDEPIYEIISNPVYHGKAGMPIRSSVEVASLGAMALAAVSVGDIDLFSCWWVAAANGGRLSVKRRALARRRWPVTQEAPVGRWARPGRSGAKN